MAFPDNDLSLGALKKCRELAGHFAMSCQATELLKLKQGMNPLDVIQDVVTRWWSTYRMLERLLYLRPYLQLMVRENLLHASLNLSGEQWQVVEDLSKSNKRWSARNMLQLLSFQVIANLIPMISSDTFIFNTH